MKKRKIIELLNVQVRVSVPGSFDATIEGKQRTCIYFADPLRRSSFQGELAERTRRSFCRFQPKKKKEKKT